MDVGVFLPSFHVEQLKCFSTNVILSTFLWHARLCKHWGDAVQPHSDAMSQEDPKHRKWHGGCRVAFSFTTDGALQRHTHSFADKSILALFTWCGPAMWSEYCILAVFAANTTSYFSVPSGPTCNKGRACQTKTVGKGIRQKKKLSRACGRVTDGRH